MGERGIVMSDIVERLRRWSHTGGCGCTRCTAADEIERLTAEVSNLKLANEEARKTIESLNAMIPREACDSPTDAPDDPSDPPAEKKSLA